MTNDDIKLKDAPKLYSDGNVKKSAELSLEVYQSTADAFTKLQAINFLTSSMNKAGHNLRLVELCDEAMGLSEKLNRDDIKATYMALKAECLMHRCMAIKYKMANMKISPGWKNFALESEKSEYEKLSNRKSNYEIESAKLLSEAMKIAEGISDKMILVRILRSQALIYGEQRAMLIFGNLRNSRLFLFFLNNFNIQPGFLCKNRKEIEKITDKCRDTFMKAIKIAGLLKNEQECAYLLFSLVGEMRVAGRKREARKYLKIAERLAYKLNEKILIQQANLLKKLINERTPKEYSKPPNPKDIDY